MSGKIKNIISFLLAAMLCAGLLSLAAYGEGETSGTCGAAGSSLDWIFDSGSGTLTISGTGAMEDYTYYNSKSTAPWQHLSGSIKQIVFSSGITYIGNYAFFETNGVEVLYLPEGITGIGSSALKGCGSLKEIVLPSSLNSIGNNAFQGLNSLAAATYAGTEATKGNITVGTNNGGLDNPQWYYVSSLSDLIYINTPSLQHGTLAPNKHYAIKGEQVNYSLSMNSGWDAALVTADHGTVNMTENYVKIDSTGDFSSLNFTVTEKEETQEYLFYKWASSGSTEPFTVNEPLTIAEDFTLPADKTLIIKADMSLSPDIRFEQNGAVKIEKNGNLSLNKTTDYICNSGITVYGELIGGSISIGTDGYIDVYGTDNSTAVKFPADDESAFSYAAGTTPVNVYNPSAIISGIPAAAVKMEKQTGDWSELKACLDFAASEDPKIPGKTVAGKVILNIAVSSPVTLGQNMQTPATLTIPENTEIHCSGTLVIPSGVTVENKGSLLLDGSYKDCTSYGTLTIEDGAALNNAGTIIVHEDELTGENNITGTGTLRIIRNRETVSTGAELRRALEYTPVEVTLSGNLDVFENLTVPAGATVIVPGGFSLHVAADREITVNGSLVNHGAVYAFGKYNGNRPDGNAPVVNSEGILDMGACGVEATDNVIWQLTNGGCLKITGTGAMMDYTLSTVPWARLSGKITSVVIDGPDNTGAGVMESALANIGVFQADGKPCTAEAIDFSRSGTVVLTVYTYNDDAPQDIHTQYPTGMKVWLLTVSGGKVTFKPAGELENILQYAGSSIRITGVKGIRMITAVDKADKTALTGAGLGGFTLEEYGTVLAFADEMEKGSLVLSDSYARSNYAYKKSVADPVFRETSTQIQYTNVLTGFTDDQCGKDIAMRPYMILKDAEGNRITVYGGTVYRSIGYIAWQNRSAFAAGTGAYSYIRHLIEIGYDE